MRPSALQARDDRLGGPHLPGQRLLRELFDELCLHPDQLPDRYQARTEQAPLPRVVCDYLAGMTDRYAQDEYLRLFQPYVPV